MKNKLYLVGFLLMFGFNCRQSMAATISHDPISKEKVAAMTEDEKKARLEAIMQRVEEIKAMDKSHLTKSERKELRKELKMMKKKATEVNGVYLSIGAIIIIVLLLILIL